MTLLFGIKHRGYGSKAAFSYLNIFSMHLLLSFDRAPIETFSSLKRRLTFKFQYDLLRDFVIVNALYWCKCASFFEEYR